MKTIFKIAMLSSLAYAGSMHAANMVTTQATTASNSVGSPQVITDHSPTAPQAAAAPVASMVTSTAPQAAAPAVDDASMGASTIGSAPATFVAPVASDDGLKFGSLPKTDETLDMSNARSLDSGYLSKIPATPDTKVAVPQTRTALDTLSSAIPAATASTVGTVPQTHKTLNAFSSAMPDVTASVVETVPQIMPSTVSSKATRLQVYQAGYRAGYKAAGSTDKEATDKLNKLHSDLHHVMNKNFQEAFEPDETSTTLKAEVPPKNDAVIKKNPNAAPFSGLPDTFNPGRAEATPTKTISGLPAQPQPVAHSYLEQSQLDARRNDG